MIESPVAPSAEAIVEHNKSIYEGLLFRFHGAETTDDDGDEGNEGGDDGDQDDNDDEDESESDQDDDDTSARDAKAKKQPRGQKQDADDDSDDEDDDKDDVEAQLAKLKRENIRLKKAQDKKDEDAKQEKDLGKKLAKAEQRAEKAERLVRTAFLEGAIRNLSSEKDKEGNPKYEWHDIEDVRRALKMDSIDIDMDSGDVDGLDLELKRIAKKKPHWLKSRDNDEDQGQGQGRGGRQQQRGGQQQRRGTGGHPYGGRTKSDQADRQKIMDKYKIGPQFVGGVRLG